MILKMLDSKPAPDPTQDTEGVIINKSQNKACGCQCGNRGLEYDTGYTKGVYE